MKGSTRYTFHSRSAFSKLHSYGFKQRSKLFPVSGDDTHPTAPSHFAAQAKPPDRGVESSLRKGSFWIWQVWYPGTGARFGWARLATHENNASRCKASTPGRLSPQGSLSFAITAKKKSTKKRPRIADGLPVFKNKVYGWTRRRGEKNVSRKSKGDPWGHAW